VSSDQRSSPPQTSGQGAPGSGAPRASPFGAFTQALNIVGTVLILVMAVAVNADVFGRNAFNHPIAGVLEFIGLSIVAIVFLQIANTLRERRHVSNDVFILMLMDTHPRLAAAMHLAFDGIGAVLMATIVVFVWPIVVEAYRGGYYAGTAEVVEIPIWPFTAVIIVGATTTAIQFLIDAWHDLMRACGRDRRDR
jgi:TRAP-type C4-dicarboxylate transport system permease small subunit